MEIETCNCFPFKRNSQYARVNTQSWLRLCPYTNCPSLLIKFQLSIHISLGTQKLRFPEAARGVTWGARPDPWLPSFIIRTRVVFDRLRSSNFRSWLMKKLMANAFASKKFTSKAALQLNFRLQVKRNHLHPVADEKTGQQRNVVVVNQRF